MVQNPPYCGLQKSVASSTGTSKTRKAKLDRLKFLCARIYYILQVPSSMVVFVPCDQSVWSHGLFQRCLAFSSKRCSLKIVTTTFIFEVILISQFQRKQRPLSPPSSPSGHFSTLSVPRVDY